MQRAYRRGGRLRYRCLGLFDRAPVATHRERLDPLAIRRLRILGVRRARAAVCCRQPIHAHVALARSGVAASPNLDRHLAHLQRHHLLDYHSPAWHLILALELSAGHVAPFVHKRFFFLLFSRRGFCLRSIDRVCICSYLSFVVFLLY